MEIEFNDISLITETGQLLKSTFINVDKHRISQVIPSMVMIMMIIYCLFIMSYSHCVFITCRHCYHAI